MVGFLRRRQALHLSKTGRVDAAQRPPSDSPSPLAPALGAHVPDPRGGLSRDASAVCLSRRGDLAAALLAFTVPHARRSPGGALGLTSWVSKTQ
jgi:hypothetical protein